MLFESSKRAVAWYCEYRMSNQRPKATYAAGSKCRAYDEEIVAATDLQKILNQFLPPTQILLFDWAVFGVDEALARLEKRMQAKLGNVIRFKSDKADEKYLAVQRGRLTRALHKAGYLKTRKRQAKKEGQVAA